MPTGSPGKLSGEAIAQVEDGPGQDDDVIDIEVRLNHLRCIADACEEEWKRAAGLSVL